MPASGLVCARAPRPIAQLTTWQGTRHRLSRKERRQQTGSALPALGRQARIAGSTGLPDMLLNQAAWLTVRLDNHGKFIATTVLAGSVSLLYNTGAVKKAASTGSAAARRRPPGGRRAPSAPIYAAAASVRSTKNASRAAGKADSTSMALGKGAKEK